MVLAIAGYEILEQLGEGGMGQVYKARHLRLDRIVALKVIHPDHLGQPDAVRRFHREARAAARLAHPNLVTIFDVDDVGGTNFLAMEYVEGIDLGRWVKSRGPVDVARACDYVRQAARGLQHIHERGLVHRDIKPSNLFVTENETLVKVLDLGLARLNQPRPSDQISNELTQPGVIMGTPAFLAPEQARDSRRVDIRSDIYSLGCTLYYLLTGRVPFPGIGLAEIVVQHQLDEPEQIENLRPDVPPGVPHVVRKMMAKRPQDRYQTPAEVAAALVPFCSPTPFEPPAHETPSPPRFPNMDPTPSATELLQVQDRKSRPQQGQRRKRQKRPILIGCGTLLLACLLGWLAAGGASLNLNEVETKVAIRKNPVVVMETSKGTVKIELFADKSPITVKNFLNHVDEKFYDGTIFHRVFSDSAIVGGGFEPGLMEKRITKPRIKNESTNGISNARGTMAMALLGVDPDSAIAVFYINVKDNPNWDPVPGRFSGYCVFGNVIEGMDVVDQIKGLKTATKTVKTLDGRIAEMENSPVEEVLIKSIRRAENR